VLKWNNTSFDRIRPSLVHTSLIFSVLLIRNILTLPSFRQNAGAPIYHPVLEYLR